MSLAATVLEKAVIAPKEAFLKFENRVPKSSLISGFREYTSEVVPEASIKALKTSRYRPVEIAVLKRKIFNVGNVRQINPTPDNADSAKVGLTWFTKTFSFNASPAMNADNYIDYVDEIRNDMFNGIMSVMYDHPSEALEKNCAAYLAANKWAVPPTSSVPGVTNGIGSYEIAARDFMINAPVVMEEQYLRGRFQDFSNIGALASRREAMTYGAGNQQNLAQFNEQFDYYLSREIPVTDGAQATHYLVPTATLAMINITEWDARHPEQSKHNTGYFDEVQDPFFGFNWGVRVVEEVADLSAGGTMPGRERQKTIRWDFAADFAILHSYASAPGTSPIMKFDAMPG